MLKKTSIVAMACVLAGSMLFAGCGGGEKKAAAPKADGNKLIIYTSMKESLIKGIVTGFEKKNPGIKVDYQSAGAGKLMAKIAAERQSGKILADVIWTSEVPDFYKMKKEGILDPKVLNVDAKTLLYQVPGGMLSNTISQLKQAGKEDKYYDVLAEVPRVRKDFGYPPLVTPTSQIVGTQAVMNVISGERYKMVPKESKALLRGEYGKLPAPVNEDVRKKAIGDDKVIDCRPADLLEPELEKYAKEMKEKGLGKSTEDVLSYALFPAVAEKFLSLRDKAPEEEPAVRELVVEDLSV